MKIKKTKNIKCGVCNKIHLPEVNCRNVINSRREAIRENEKRIARNK
jgi:hypothetical protein